MATLLLVDDNEDDLFALRRSLTRAGVSAALQVASNGQQAIDYLAGSGDFADRQKHPVPALMFLDLKMPLRSGFDVLSWMRARPEMSSIPVVVLSGSDEPRDHERAAALGARHYLVKPPTTADVASIIAATPLSN